MGGGIDGNGEMEKCRHSYILYMYICIYMSCHGYVGGW